jgi:hypothetical protein
MTILITGANRGIGAGWPRPTVRTGQEVIAAARPGTDTPLDVTDPTSIRRRWPTAFGTRHRPSGLQRGRLSRQGHEPVETGFDADTWAAPSPSTSPASS